MYERTCFSEKHVTFENVALFTHLHGKPKSVAISKLACFSLKRVRSYIGLALERQQNSKRKIWPLTIAPCFTDSAIQCSTELLKVSAVLLMFSRIIHQKID